MSKKTSKTRAAKKPRTSERRSHPYRKLVEGTLREGSGSRRAPRSEAPRLARVEPDAQVVGNIDDAIARGERTRAEILERIERSFAAESVPPAIRRR